MESLPSFLLMQHGWVHPYCAYHDHVWRVSNVVKYDKSLEEKDTVTEASTTTTTTTPTETQTAHDTAMLESLENEDTKSWNDEQTSYTTGPIRIEEEDVYKWVRWLARHDMSYDQIQSCTSWRKRNWYVTCFILDMLLNKKNLIPYSQTTTDAIEMFISMREVLGKGSYGTVSSVYLVCPPQMMMMTVEQDCSNGETLSYKSPPQSHRQRIHLLHPFPLAMKMITWRNGDMNQMYNSVIKTRNEIHAMIRTNLIFERTHVPHFVLYYGARHVLEPSRHFQPGFYSDHNLHMACVTAQEYCSKHENEYHSWYLEQFKLVSLAELNHRNESSYMVLFQELCDDTLLNLFRRRKTDVNAWNEYLECMQCVKQGACQNEDSMTTVSYPEDLNTVEQRETAFILILLFQTLMACVTMGRYQDMVHNDLYVSNIGYVRADKDYKHGAILEYQLHAPRPLGTVITTHGSSLQNNHYYSYQIQYCALLIRLFDFNFASSNHVIQHAPLTTHDAVYIEPAGLHAWNKQYAKLPSLEKWWKATNQSFSWEYLLDQFITLHLPSKLKTSQAGEKTNGSSKDLSTTPKEDMCLFGMYCGKPIDPVNMQSLQMIASSTHVVFWNFPPYIRDLIAVLSSIYKCVSEYQIAPPLIPWIEACVQDLEQFLIQDHVIQQQQQQQQQKTPSMNVHEQQEAKQETRGIFLHVSDLEHVIHRMFDTACLQKHGLPTSWIKCTPSVADDSLTTTTYSSLST